MNGFPYTSQDQEVARCAQASLWMLVRYFSNKYPNYREIGPHQLANLVSDIHLGRLFPSDGLTVWQSAEILRRLGFHPVVHHKSAFHDEHDKPKEIVNRLGFKSYQDAFAHLFYTYIESGIPLLVATKTHARVAFIAPMPEKTYLPADTHQRLVRQLLLNGGEHSMSGCCPELAAAVQRKQIDLRNFSDHRHALQGILGGKEGTAGRFL